MPKNSKVKKSAKGKPVAKPIREIAERTSSKVMDRTTLKEIAATLKEHGQTLKVLKSDTDEILQKKVNEGLAKLPSAEMLKKLEAVDPVKLMAVLKKDCLGIFIDLADVSCVNCVNVTQCAQAFINNLRGGLRVVDGAEKAKEPAKATAAPKQEKKMIDPVDPAATLRALLAKEGPSAPKFVKAKNFKSDRLVIVRDRKNPNEPGDDNYDTIAAILKEKPITLGGVRKIAERDFDISDDADFMAFVNALRDREEGVVMLDLDLTDARKAELEKATAAG